MLEAAQSIADSLLTDTSTSTRNQAADAVATTPPGDTTPGLLRTAAVGAFLAGAAATAMNNVCQPIGSSAGVLKFSGLHAGAMDKFLGI